MARARTPPRPPLPRFAVAWFPRFEGLEAIEAFRARHDPQAGKVAAHLSLVFPFAASHTRLQIQTHVQAVAARFPPVPVTFRRVRTEANEFVFLMAQRGASAIKELHDRLYTRTLQQHLRRDMPYEPHITLARHAAIGRLDAALAEAEETLAGPYEDLIRDITLLSVLADGKIVPLKTIALNTA